MFSMIHRTGKIAVLPIESTICPPEVEVNHASFVTGNQEIEQRHPSNTAICSERSIAQFISSVVIYQSIE
jgi:hypothetical protein